MKDKDAKKPKKKKDQKEQKDCPKCQEYLVGWKRALADYDNLQKHLAQEKVEMRHAVKKQMIEELLPVLDNFDQAVKFQPEGLDQKAAGWASGILYVRTQLEEVLRHMGTEPYGVPGEMFDPNLHDAAAERHEKGKKEGEILEVVVRGWKMGEYIIRPAKVVVNNS